MLTAFGRGNSIVKKHFLSAFPSAAATHSNPIPAALCLICIALLGGSSVSLADVFPGVSLRILNKTAPPGGLIQLTVIPTEPKPITSGRSVVAFDQGPLDSVQGAALFSPAGDVSGAAVISGSQVRFQFTSPQATFGTDIGTPLLVVSIAVRPDARWGDRAHLTLDTTSSLWLDLFGDPYPQEVRSGVFTVGGTVSIADVVPGSGVLPAGSTVTLSGVGFQPLTRAEIDDVNILFTRFVSSTQLDVVIAQPAQMYGRRVRVRNPDRSEAVYYSYLRAVPQGQSARSLLAATVPIFALQTLTAAHFNTLSDSNLFLGLAFQNPTAESAAITIEMYSAAKELIASANLVLPPHARTSREVSEFLTGVAPPAGSYLRVVSSVPVQMLGLIGNEATGSVAPMNPTPAP